METKTKTSAKSKVDKAPTAKAETPKMKLLNTEKIEEAEIIENFKPKQNLDETMKIVTDLYNKKRQRDMLDITLEKLQDFEIEHEQEDLDNDSHFTGCAITIRDEKRNEWTTKNPKIIKDVVDFMIGRFNLRLSEIEAQIILP